MRDTGKPHIYRRRGKWFIYYPPVGFEDGSIGELRGSSISEHRMHCGLQK